MEIAVKRLALVCVVLLALAAGSVYLAQDSPADTGTGFARYRNVLVCYALFGLFLVSLPYLGMLIAGVLFVFSSLTLLGPPTLRSVPRHALIAVLTVGGMWLLFTYGLNVILPEGVVLRTR